jgi:hypothetical protein
VGRRAALNFGMPAFLVTTPSKGDRDADIELERFARSSIISCSATAGLRAVPIYIWLMI